MVSGSTRFQGVSKGCDCVCKLRLECMSYSCRCVSPSVARGSLLASLPGRGLAQGVALAVLGLELLAAGPGLGSGVDSWTIFGHCGLRTSPDISGQLRTLSWLPLRVRPV